ncbi:MAG: Crp/Fnr family transcriptional regulator [Bacteroidetes bacterium]|nr:Crp/Fnr family transcriptional regulator [Bacteroidota bacterium]
MDELFNHLVPLLGKELTEQLIEKSKLLTIEPEVEILRNGQYIKVIPIILSGLVKVVLPVDDKELLLYYIKPNESCVLTLSAGLSELPSSIIAKTELPTQLIAVPVEQLKMLIQDYPVLNRLFYEQYNTRYNELVDTIKHLVFDTLDTRLLDYLREKAKATGSGSVKISHRQVAEELGTSREVISRVIKKLEKSGVVEQHSGIISLR